MLNSYLTATNNLLQNPGATNPLYSTASLTTYINTARGQLAGESGCIRFMGSLSMVIGTQVYEFGNIALTGGAAAGIEGVLNVKTAWFTVGTGQKRMTPRSFEWFSLFEFNNPTPQSGEPKTWSQFAQGVLGSIYVSPLPDTTYTLLLDCMCYPIPLVDDTTVEAIPYLWTDAVPYFAAYLALLSSQTGARSQEADQMFKRYQLFVQRARAAATPSANPDIYQGTASPTRDAVVGAPNASAGGGGQ